MNSIFINKLVSTFNYARAYRVSFNWLNESSAPSVGQHRGMEQLVARYAHNVEVGGPIPSSATMKQKDCFQDNKIIYILWKEKNSYSK